MGRFTFERAEQLFRETFGEEELHSAGFSSGATNGRGGVSHAHDDVFDRMLGNSNNNNGGAAQRRSNKNNQLAQRHDPFHGFMDDDFFGEDDFFRQASNPFGMA
jgi:hypothetical protein